MGELKMNNLFQSPSLRGSGRFPWTRRSPRSTSSSFNPLHCGAVVASPAVGRGEGPPRLVSIPFIAGQWSLPRRTAGGGKGGPHVSIPFIAGQWSLHSKPWPDSGPMPCFNPLHCGAVVASPPPKGGGRSVCISFQSPSLRGSGRFLHPGGSSRYEA